MKEKRGRQANKMWTNERKGRMQAEGEVDMEIDRQNEKRSG